MDDTLPPVEEAPKPDEETPVVVPEDIESMSFIDLYHWAHTMTPNDWDYKAHFGPERVASMTARGAAFRKLAETSLENQQELASRLLEFVVADNPVLLMMASRSIVEAIGFAWAIAQERWGLVIPTKPK